ncbi:U3 small nucleolar RNA-associated protein MPP10 [Grifola frondosa]|uniref:U3 small nucleolar RNA-associated protein MPP10 n=1 Tax=Grifola frondosa TaxID=5627 RepID=A0A1C7MQK2_GRIFR|nr:U3 small nucleolar RNA-associated protein MPP10 [Grifola frondosa]
MSVDSPEDVQLPSDLENLSLLVEEKPEGFAAGSEDIRIAALQATKWVYDLALKTEASSRAHIAELLSSISPTLAPQTRSQTAANGKRKRGPSPPSVPPAPALKETPLTELFTEDGTPEGMTSDEEDDREIKKLRKEFLDRGLDPSILESLDLDADMDSEDEEDEDEDDDEGEDEDSESQDEESEEDGEEDVDLEEGIVELHDPSDEDEEDDEGLELDKPSILKGGTRALRWRPKPTSHPELDDGFFDLATFNAETEEAEAQAVSKGKLGKDDDDDEDDVGDDESVDLFASVDDTTTLDEADLEHGESELFYKDFFDPPVQSTKANKAPKTDRISNGKVRFHEEVRVKKIKAKGKNLPVSTIFSEEDEEEDEDEYGEMMLDEESEPDSDEDEDEDENNVESSEENSDQGSEDGQETIERLKDDLFADEEELDSGLSTHEKRMAQLREEISALEAENVAKKDWTLLGEATARSRPQNSLLEEDLDFERVMKSVPVITEEVVQGLEERIKARILESQFDDVVRQRPVDDKPFLPSRFFELQDTKSKQSLAEIYEDEYTAVQTGGVAGEDRDGKLKKEHDEIEKLWENICSKLDALCNAHFTPKAPKASISSIANVAAATLESALPTTKATSAMLAPEEIFAPSSGDLRVRSEMTPAEKRALQNKQKKAKKHVRDALEKSVDKFARIKGIGGIKKQKEAALKSVVKSGRGVTVVGKKSKELEGKRTRTKTS